MSKTSSKLQAMRDKIRLLQEYAEVSPEAMKEILKQYFNGDDYKMVRDPDDSSVIVCMLDRSENVCGEFWRDRGTRWSLWADSASGFYTRLSREYARNKQTPIDRSMPEDDWWLTKLGELYGNGTA